jgi:hypothetical protein
VSATAGQAQDERGQAERLGIKPGQVVQEIGHDDDCDEQLRDAISRIDGVELVDEDYDDVVDVTWPARLRREQPSRRSPTAGTSGCSRRRRAGQVTSSRATSARPRRRRACHRPRA